MAKQEQLSSAEYRNLTGRDACATGGKRRKWGNVKVVVDGITFDSKAEAKRYGELKMGERAGELRDIQVHQAFPIYVNKIRVCDYEADFFYFTGPPKEGMRSAVVEDVKGKATPEFRIKAKLMLAVYGIDVKVIR